MTANRAALQAEVNANLADNTTGAITPALLRTTLNDILTNVATLLDTDTITGVKTLNPPIFSGLSGLLQGNGSSAVTALTTAQAIATATPGRIYLTATSVNLNNVGDTTVPVVLPSGMTRFKVAEMHVSHASLSLTTVTVGLYTAASAGGVAIVTPATTGITSTTTDTSPNAASMTVINPNTTSYNDANLYIHVAIAQGAAATGDVTIVLIPLP